MSIIERGDAQRLAENPIYKAFLNGEVIIYRSPSGTYHLEKLAYAQLLQMPERYSIQDFPELPAGGKWHNRGSLNATQFGCHEGWRPLLTDEKLPEDYEFYRDGRWQKEPRDKLIGTYVYQLNKDCGPLRTKTPIPADRAPAFKEGDVIIHVESKCVVKVTSHHLGESILGISITDTWNPGSRVAIPSHNVNMWKLAEKTPLEQDDVPPGTAVRFKDKKRWDLINTTWVEGFATAGIDKITHRWEAAMEQEMEILRPGSKEWEPCYKFKA